MFFLGDKKKLIRVNYLISFMADLVDKIKYEKSEFYVNLLF